MKTKQKWLVGALALALMPSTMALAQTKNETKIYVCTDSNGGVTIQNITARANCATHVIKLPMEVAPIARPTARMVDPQPAAGAMVVGKQVVGTQVNPVVQQSRDQSRIKILTGELGRAQEKLAALQTEASSPSSLRLNPDLKKNLALAEENVASLQRELNQAAGGSSVVFTVQ